jgi:hypothetical protein
MEKHYTFIKDGVVENTLVFTERNDALAQTIVDEQGYDSFIWLDDAVVPIRWSTYDGVSFTPPTTEYLISIGIITPIVEETPAE